VYYLPESGIFTEASVADLELWYAGVDADTRGLVCTEADFLRTDYHQFHAFTQAKRYTSAMSSIVTDVEQGPVLCCIVLIAWTLSICSVLRGIIDFMASVFQARSGSSQSMCIELHMRRFSLSDIPMHRVIWAWMVGALRATIALSLLINGGLWMISTTEISDLVLNAVALTYIMDIDELLFQTTVPLEVRVIMLNMEPLSLNVLRPKCVPAWIPLRAVSSYFVVFAVLMVLGNGYLQPHGLIVHEVMDLICPGR